MITTIGNRVPSRYQESAPISGEIIQSDAPNMQLITGASLEDEDVFQSSLLGPPQQRDLSNGAIAPLSFANSVYNTNSDAAAEVGARKRGRTSDVWKYYQFIDPENTKFNTGGRVKCITCG